MTTFYYIYFDISYNKSDHINPMNEVGLKISIRTTSLLLKVRKEGVSRVIVKGLVQCAIMDYGFPIFKFFSGISFRIKWS